MGVGLERSCQLGRYPYKPLMVYALAQAAFDNGWSDLAILVLLGFDRFARSGELFMAKRANSSKQRQSGRFL